MNIPGALNFVAPSVPTPVIQRRSLFKLRNTATNVGTDQNNRIDFRLNTRSFVDLNTFQLRMSVEREGHIPSEVPFNAYHVFDEITLRNEAGTIIERLDDASTIAQIMLNLHATPEYLRDAGAFQGCPTEDGLSLVGTGTNVSTFSTARGGMKSLKTAYEIPVMKLLGFFRTGKIIRPSTFGGLHLQFRIASYAQMHRGGTKTVGNVEATKYSFSDIDLFYDEVMVTEAYEDFYNQNFDTRGFRLDIQTFDHVSNVINGDNTSDHVLRLPFSVTNATALITVIRNSATKIAATRNYFGFLPPDCESTSDGATIGAGAYMVPHDTASAYDFNYQYVNEGQRYPQVRVENIERAYHEVQKMVNATTSLRRSSLIDYKNFALHGEFVSNVNAITARTDVQAVEVPPILYEGKFMASACLQRVLGSAFSGVPLDSNTCSLEIKSNIKVAADNNLILDTFCHYTASIYVLNGQVSVSK
jgi:hypothetical protein